MDKKNLSESDICDKFVRPALVAAGWHTLDQIYAQYPLRDGRVVVRGKTARRDQNTVLRADYALFFKANIPLAVVEVKQARLSIHAGTQQAIQYAQLLDVPFSFASNGDGFVFRDATCATGVLEQTIGLDEFPSPQELWRRYCAWKGWAPAVQRVAETPYAPAKVPRYYQLTAINRTVEAIAAGQHRVLLVMATGTGKTYTAFQIIHRLWKSDWRADKAKGQKRILFLADRNILVDQTMVNDFRPFKGAMAKLSPNAKGIERVDAQGHVTVEDIDLAVNKSTKEVNKSYEIYLSLYQAVSGTDEDSNIYKQFSPDFFDLIVVDECHRGSAAEDSAWREILSYFSSATQIGLTATPKETKDISNSDYFGEPLYTYSLKQGIEDGYLAPYKVIRVDLDKDTPRRTIPYRHPRHPAAPAVCRVTHPPVDQPIHPGPAGRGAGARGGLNMLDQVEAFFSLLDRFKRFCGAQSQPPVPETLAGRFFRLFEAHGEGLMKYPYAQPGAREKFEMALEAQRAV